MARGKVLATEERILLNNAIVVKILAAESTRPISQLPPKVASETTDSSGKSTGAGDALTLALSCIVDQALQRSLPSLHLHGLALDEHFVDQFAAFVRRFGGARAVSAEFPTEDQLHRYA